MSEFNKKHKAPVTGELRRALNSQTPKKSGVDIRIVLSILAILLSLLALGFVLLPPLLAGDVDSTPSEVATEDMLQETVSALDIRLQTLEVTSEVTVPAFPTNTAIPSVIPSPEATEDAEATEVPEATENSEVTEVPEATEDAVGDAQTDEEVPATEDPVEIAQTGEDVTTPTVVATVDLSTSTPEATEAPTQYTWIVGDNICTSICSVRANAGTQYATVGTISPRDTVIITGYTFGTDIDTTADEEAATNEQTTDAQEDATISDDPPPINIDGIQRGWFLVIIETDTGQVEGYIWSRLVPIDLQPIAIDAVPNLDEE